MSIEKINREWKPETVTIRRFSDKGFAVNIEYYNFDVCNFFISHTGFRDMYNKITDELQRGLEDE